MIDNLSLKSKMRRKFTCFFQILFASENTHTHNILRLKSTDRIYIIEISSDTYFVGS